MNEVYRKYYKSNYGKAMANLKKGKAEVKAKFIKEYPHADLAKFNFTTTINKNGDIESSDVWFINSDTMSTNVDSDTFRNDYTMNKYLTSGTSVVRTAAENSEVRTNFISKYSHADLSKFKFTVTVYKNNIESSDVWFINSDTVSTNVDSDTFRNDHTMNKYLTSGKVSSTPEQEGNFPKIWLSNGTIQKIPKGYGHFFTRFGKRSGYYDSFPVHDILNYPVNNFRVYVNSKDYFMSKLPELKIYYPGKPFVWDDSGSYFRSLFAVYLSTFCCGVSLQHLTPNDSIYPVITSILRFHLYFTVRRLLKRMQKGESMYSLSKEFNGGNLYRVILKLPWDFSYESKVTDGIKSVENINVVKGNYKTHYKRYIPKVSNGLTKIGLQYLNQSIEAYVYTILGSQAKTRVSVINHGGGSLETQQEFRSLVEDSVINYSISTWILNMNKSISDTFVKQDLAISPKTWLVPSKMVILKNPIAGYNNLLKTASDTMTFGVNDINHRSTRVAKPKKQFLPAKVFTEAKPKPIVNKKPTKVFTELEPNKKQTFTEPAKKTEEKQTPNRKQTLVNEKSKPDNSGLILISATVGGFLISKYV